MTKGEAINALGLMEHVESIVAVYAPGERRDDTTVRELKEACRVAIAALQAQQEGVKLDRSKWEGCGWCRQFCGIPLRGFTPYGCTSITAKYCPNCGKPLAEEAWAETERKKMEGQ